MIKTSLKKPIYLSPPHMSGNEQKYIQEAFDSNWVSTVGPNVQHFEKEVAHLIGVKEAVAVSSGTAAIHLALLLADVTKGDTVFCSSLTFVASANPVLYLGAIPVFIDSEPDTWCMSPNALRKAFKDCEKRGKLPKAVIVVNLYGQVAKMQEICEICQEYDVKLIEDAAESLGSTYKGQQSGSFGDFGIISLNGNKIITSSGGGILTCHNRDMAEKARFLATQAKDPAVHYQHSQIGFNYRLSNILAGIGRAQLEVLEERVLARRRIFSTYFEELSDIPGVQFMPELEYTRSNRWLTAMTINEQEAGFSVHDILHSLADHNIEARPVWKPMHLQPLFRENKYFHNNEGEDISRQLFLTGICLPSGSNLTENQQKSVIQCIKNMTGSV